MPDITGPVGMTLLEKNGVRYLLIGDKHTRFTEGMCKTEGTILLPSYLDKLFSKFRKDQWDFYLEQGVAEVNKEGDYFVNEETGEKRKGKFLNKAKEQLTLIKLELYNSEYRDNLRNPQDIMELTYNYFRGQGCFFTDRQICDKTFKNVRFHFIDTRQAYLGESCELPSFEKFNDIGIEAKTLYTGLFDVVTKLKWSGRSEVEKLLNDYCDEYFENVKRVLNCMNEKKVLKQFENSTMKTELDKYFEPALRLFNIVLLSIYKKMKPQQEEIVYNVLLSIGQYINDDDYEDKLFESITQLMPSILGEKIFGEAHWESLLEMVQNSDYLKIATSRVDMKERIHLDPTHLVFEGNKLIMDMYALGRITKPYNQNVVMIAGHNHFNNYLHFFKRNGFKTVWVGESIEPKCIRIPEWQPRKKMLGLFGGTKTQKRIPLCCNATRNDKTCRRGSDGKVFSLPRKFTRRNCISKNRFGFSERASCAPYLGGKRREKKTRKKGRTNKKPQFLYHPNNPDKSFDVYIDKNPKDTIPIKFTTLDDVKHTIRKLERLYKSGKYSHKRIWQVGMIMKVRLDAIKKHHPQVKGINGRVALAQKYFKFLGERTKRKTLKERKEMEFKC